MAGSTFVIAMVTPRLPPAGNVTGSPAHVMKTVRALQGLGARVQVIELELERVRVPPALAMVVARAHAALRKLRPDVLHVHGHVAAALLMPSARWLHVPMAVEIHGLYAPSSRGQAGARPTLSRLAAALELPIVRRADHVIAQAAAMRDRLLRAGVAEDRITVVYPGLRTTEFSAYAGPAAEVPAGRPGERCVIYIGSTHHYQGLDLLAASQRLLPEGYRVILVVSRDAGETEDVIGRFGFDTCMTTVVHPDTPDAIPAWTRRADVLVHARPDIPDNVNVQSKLGLYLASGRPIVTTDVGDYRVLLSDSRGCVVVAPAPRPFAEGIVRGATDPAVRRAAERDNPVLAVRHFEAATNAKRLIEIYRACAAAGRRR